MTENIVYPHCDSQVLHSPGVCEYCDWHPDWQAYRQGAGIAFTDQEPGDYLTPCPSTYRRSAGVRDQWGGNRPSRFLIQGRP